MDQVKIGKFLLELRKKEGLTQEALGQRLGVTNKTVSRWETGTYMPDIETLLALSKLYHVSVSELLCGEYLTNEDFRDKAEEAVVLAVSDKKRAVRKIVKTAAVLFICLTLGFLSAFAIGFITARNQALEPLRVANGQIDPKTQQSSITVPEGEPGDVVYRFSDTGIAVRLPIDGFAEVDDRNVFMREETDEWLTVRAYYTAAYPCPTTIELQEYFASAGISSLTDKMWFAMHYSVEDVGIFSSDKEIDMAIGCRMLLAHMSFANRSETTCGEIRPLNGKWKGYAVSNGAADLPGNVWSFILEDQYRLLFLVVKSDTICATPESMAQWLSAVEFADETLN